MPVTGDGINNGDNKCWMNAPLYAFLAHEQTWNIYKKYNDIDSDSKIIKEHSFLTYLRKNPDDWNGNTYNAVQYYLYKLGTSNQDRIVNIKDNLNVGDISKEDFQTIKIFVNRQKRLHSDFEDSIAELLKRIFVKGVDNAANDLYLELAGMNMIKETINRYQKDDMYCLSIIMPTECRYVGDDIGHYIAFVRRGEDEWLRFDADAKGTIPHKGLHLHGDDVFTINKIIIHYKCQFPAERHCNLLFVNTNPSNEIIQEKPEVTLNNKLITEVADKYKKNNLTNLTDLNKLTNEVRDLTYILGFPKNEAEMDDNFKLITFIIDKYGYEHVEKVRKYIDNNKKINRHTLIDELKRTNDTLPEKKIIDEYTPINVTMGEQSNYESTDEGASLSKQGLINMGFSKENVEQALKRSNNNFDQALNFLTKSMGGSRRNRRNDRKQNRKQNQRTRKRKTSLT